MKSNFKITIRAACHWFDIMVRTGIVMLIVGNAQAQNLFVAQANSDNIIEVAPNGSETVFATGLNGPDGLAFNSSGNLFVSDYYSGNIYEFTPGGSRSTFASGLYEPTGLAFDSGGNLFVAGTGGTITEITPGTVKSTFASGLSSPNGIAFDRAGNLFVANTGANDIIRITPGGVQSTFVSGLSQPVGLGFNAAGELFVANAGNGSVNEITPGGFVGYFASGFLALNALTLDSSGNVYVSQGFIFAENIYVFKQGVESVFAAGVAGEMAFEPVPEPSILGLLTIGATMLFLFVRLTSNAGLTQTRHPAPGERLFSSRTSVARAWLR